MRVLHIGLASHYTEGMSYQDNLLPEMNLQEGHEVVFITDTYKYIHGELIHGREEDSVLPNGLRLIRLEYDKIINEFVTVKIQKVHRLRFLLEEIRPDAILYHGLCGYELMAVAEYVKEHGTVFYADSHEDFTNTAKTPVAKMAYKYIHGFFIKKAMSCINKVLYLSRETKDYLKDMYHLEDAVLEFYPLGGIMQEKCQKEIQRKILIEKMKFPEDVVIFSHSGKLAKEKKTAELLRAFSASADDKMRLLIFGSIPEEQKKELTLLMQKDARVHFLGWKSGQEIIDLLNATDMYLQPGSQSATSQTALCCGCAEVVAPTLSYREMYGDAVIYADSQGELEEVFRRISHKTLRIEDYKEKGRKCAEEKLDYRVLARRYLQ